MRYLPLTALLLVACASGRPTGVTRADSAGIEVVTGPAADRPSDQALRALDTIYDPATDTVLQGDTQSLGVGADAQGHLTFADGGFTDRRVLRLAPGPVWHQVGRHGGGPGEYQILTHLIVAPDGGLFVGDVAKQAFLRFGPTDSVLPAVPWSAFGRGFIQMAGYGAGGIVAVLSEMSESTSVYTIRHLGPADTSTIATIHDPAPKQLMYESCRVGFMGAPLFHPSPRWAGNGAEVAFATTDQYEVRVWKDGKVARIIRRPIAPRTATKALAQQDVGAGFTITIQGRKCTVPPADIVEQQGYAATIPAIKSLALAPDGTLWVARYTVGSEAPLADLFDPTGAYEGTLTGTIAWPHAWLPDGRFVAVLPNADSLPVVVRYQLGSGGRQE